MWKGNLCYQQKQKSISGAVPRRLPRWGTLLVSLGALAGCVAFTGSQLHVVKITDTHGAQGMAITSAHDIKTLMQQAGIAAPDTEDELEITEDAGLDQIHILRAYTVPVTVDGVCRRL